MFCEAAKAKERSRASKDKDAAARGGGKPGGRATIIDCAAGHLEAEGVDLDAFFKLYEQVGRRGGGAARLGCPRGASAPSVARRGQGRYAA